jgi:hypothetical protein
MTMLSDERAAAVDALCELVVPGSSAVGPAVYIEAVLAEMPEAAREHALAAIDALAPAAAGGTEALAQRALAIEAYYSDFIAPDRDAPGAYEDIDFNSPLARRINKDWSFMGIS